MVDPRHACEALHTGGGAQRAVRARALVYLPPQYFQKAYARTLFPAVEVMTGYPGIDAGPRLAG